MNVAVTPAPGRTTLDQAFNYVDGERVSGAAYDVINPADVAEVVGIAHAATPALVERAAASQAKAQSDWAANSLDRRIMLVREALQGVAALGDPDELATLLTREQGKILMEARWETGRVTALVDLFAGLAAEALAEDDLADEKGRRLKGFVPIGPVAAITPWNWPVSLSMGKIVPALLAGNTITLKPPPNTPLTISAIVGAIAERLPPGVLNLVNGGADVGAALVAHPAIRKVVFTGSTASGKRVFEACAGHIKNMTLELGGNDAALLLNDIVLDDATVARIMGSAFITAGQVCWAIKRVYVPRAREAEVVDALVAAAERFVVGNGLAPAATMGPLNNATQQGIVRRMIDEARALGGRVTECGGIVPDTRFDDGYFMRPVIVSGVGDDASLVAEEQFGPALPVVAYDGVDDGVARANGTEYGLCASVWTSDEGRGFDVARRLEAGQVFVNCHAGPALDYANAFGGIKQSGLGREMGVEGVRAYLEPRLYSSRVLR